MTKIVILDDEKHCTDMLQSLIIKMHRDYHIAGVFNDPLEALKFVQNEEVDLLFLDIQMPKLNGFQLLDKILPVSFDIIFTTAYDQYAIRAFQYSAINYLLKPISEKDLVKALLSWEQRKHKTNPEQWQLLRKAMNDTGEGLTKIALPTGTGFQIIKLADIVRCKSENNYTSFYFQDGSKTIICRTLKEVEGMLPESTFVRVHQSHLIHTKYVKNISKRGNGVICMEDGVEVPVSRQRRSYMDKILASMLHFD